jgi:hypothetical protein
MIMNLRATVGSGWLAALGIRLANSGVRVYSKLKFSCASRSSICCKAAVNSRFLVSSFSASFVSSVPKSFFRSWHDRARFASAWGWLQASSFRSTC